MFSYESDVSMPDSPVYDRYKSGEGYHAVPPPYIGTFMPHKPDLVFHDALTINETVPTAFNVELSPTKSDKYLSQSNRPSVPLIKDWVSDSKYDSKGIKREFSIARTPQQNEIAERKNRCLIEAARTMLADSLLHFPFWAKAVTTAVTKPHNKTAYELLLGRTPSIGFMRPFGCPVTILNTLDPLENHPNVVGSGPTWLFDIDTLTKSMNYQPVTAGNQPNPSTVKELEFKVKKLESAVHVSLCNSAKTKKHDDMTTREAKGNSLVELSTGFRNFSEEFEDFFYNNINEVNAASTPVPAVGLILTNTTNTFSAAALEDITYSHAEEDVGADADFSNLETSIHVNPIPTTRVHKDHHVAIMIVVVFDQGPKITKGTNNRQKKDLEMNKRSIKCAETKYGALHKEVRHTLDHGKRKLNAEMKYVALPKEVRKHFKTLSLDKLRSPDFNLFSNQEYSEEEVAETMAETMEQYMSKTRADYGSGFDRPKIEDNDNFELNGQFFKELRTNTFSSSDHEDANEHIEKVLEIVDLFHIPNITIDQVMLRAFPMSLTRAASHWLRNEPTEENSEEEVAETMAETMEQYMNKTQAYYGSGIARPKIDEKYHFELKGQFLKEL
nr:hypothetical protein [Tanacetum cinerariifolium]